MTRGFTIGMQAAVGTNSARRGDNYEKSATSEMHFNITEFRRTPLCAVGTQQANAREMRIVTKQGRNRGELGPVIGGKAKKATTFSTATLALEGGARSFCLFFSSREPTVKDINLSSTAF